MIVVIAGVGVGCVTGADKERAGRFGGWEEKACWPNPLAPGPELLVRGPMERWVECRCSGSWVTDREVVKGMKRGPWRGAGVRGVKGGDSLSSLCPRRFIHM